MSVFTEHKLKNSPAAIQLILHATVCLHPIAKEGAGKRPWLVKGQLWKVDARQLQRGNGYSCLLSCSRNASGLTPPSNAVIHAEGRVPLEESGRELIPASRRGERFATRARAFPQGFQRFKLDGSRHVPLRRMRGTARESALAARLKISTPSSRPALPSPEGWPRAGSRSPPTDSGAPSQREWRAPGRRADVIVRLRGPWAGGGGPRSSNCAAQPAVQPASLLPGLWRLLVALLFRVGRVCPVIYSPEESTFALSFFPIEVINPVVETQKLYEGI